MSSTLSRPAVDEAYTNEATVTAEIPNGPTLTDQDSAAVAVTGIAITKTAQSTVVPAGTGAVAEITVAAAPRAHQRGGCT